MKVFYSTHRCMQTFCKKNRNDQAGFDASVDLWSFGCTLYHLATGQIPFRTHSVLRNKEKDVEMLGSHFFIHFSCPTCLTIPCVVFISVIF